MSSDCYFVEEPLLGRAESAPDDCTIKSFFVDESLERELTDVEARSDSRPSIFSCIPCPSRTLSYGAPSFERSLGDGCAGYLRRGTTRFVGMFRHRVIPETGRVFPNCSIRAQMTPSLKLTMV